MALMARSLTALSTSTIKLLITRPPKLCPTNTIFCEFWLKFHFELLLYVTNYIWQVQIKTLNNTNYHLILFKCIFIDWKRIIDHCEPLDLPSSRNWCSLIKLTSF
jgi:hypothetical protein